MAIEAPRMTQSPSNDIRGQVERIWASSGASTTTLEILLAIISAESNFKNVEGITGDMGLLQFAPATWSDVCEGDPYNVEDNVRCGIQEIEELRLWRWSASREDRSPFYKGWFGRLTTTTQLVVRKKDVLCNCMAYLRNEGLKFKGNAKDIPVNSTPFIGAIVKFYYANTGTYHGAKLVGYGKGGFYVDDSNYKPCEETKGRFVAWDNNDSLIGFSDI